MDKVNINDKYEKDCEIRKSLLPYKDYYDCLINTFDLHL